MNDNPVFATMQGVARLVTTLAFDLKVYGKHYVPRKGGVLIVGNHQSYIDPPSIGAQIPRMTNYIGKSELFETKFTNWINRRMGAFPVRQGEGDIAAVREAIKRLQAGAALVLFPEGARTEDGELQPIAPGVGLIARKAGVPVVPCVIEGSYDAWPRGAKFFRCRPIRLQFGPPMKVDHMKAQAIVQTIDETLHRMLHDLRQRMKQEEIWTGRS
jgi:1-acyl-sn-glycerol-3-phosphate acyltransferase